MPVALGVSSRRRAITVKRKAGSLVAGIFLQEVSARVSQRVSFGTKIEPLKTSLFAVTFYYPTSKLVNNATLASRSIDQHGTIETTVPDDPAIDQNVKIQSNGLN